MYSINNSVNLTNSQHRYSHNLIFLFILAFQVINKSTSAVNKRSGGAGCNSHSESTVVNAIQSRVFGTNRAAVNQSNKQVTPIIPQQTPFFKTAGTELVCHCSQAYKFDLLYIFYVDFKFKYFLLNKIVS